MSTGRDIRLLNYFLSLTSFSITLISSEHILIISENYEIFLHSRVVVFLQKEYEECEMFSSFLDFIYALCDTLCDQTSYMPSLCCQSPPNSRSSLAAGVKMSSPSCHVILENRWIRFSTKFSKQKIPPKLKPIFKYFYQKSNTIKKKFTSSQSDVRIHA